MTRRPLHIGLVAGEVSGDLMGARLVRALRGESAGRALRLSGVGGDALAGEGLDSCFDMVDLSVMGLTDVIARLPRLLARRRLLLDRFAEDPPDVIVGIDASAFFRSLSLALARRRHTARRVLYKAPQAWAYWPWRARRLAGLYDRILAILPFEPAFFADYGVAAEFVGHPALDAGIQAADGSAIRQRLGIAPDAPVLACLPGSRSSEVARLAGRFGAVVARLHRLHRDLTVLVPTIGPVAPAVSEAVADWSVPVHVVTGDADRYAALRAADAALTASGTASTELAIAGTPMVVAYRIDPFSAAVARRVMRVRYVTVTNLVLERLAVPEFLQDDFTVDALADALNELLIDSPARRRQLDDLSEAVKLLAGPHGSPSQTAARAIIEEAG